MDAGAMTASPGLDPFRARQVPEVGARFKAEREAHQRQADLAWLGVLVGMFSDHELGILNDLGHLSRHDHDLIAQCGRRPKTGSPS